jgi:hypothetical protein
MPTCVIRNRWTAILAVFLVLAFILAAMYACFNACTSVIAVTIESDVKHEKRSGARCDEQRLRGMG